MKPIPIPDNETERLAALNEYQILDTAQEEIFDTITLIAAKICRVQISLIVLIDKDRQWFKSTQGVPEGFKDIKETPREIAFCAHTIMHDGIMEVHDLSQDERFNQNPFVAENPHLRFYAGAPLVSKNDLNIGTICVLDAEPKVLDEEQKTILSNLATIIMSLLTLKKSLVEINKLKERDIEFREILAEQNVIAANKANQAKSKFLASMSHELRTPLNGVIGMTDLISHMDMNEDLKECIGVVQNSGDMLLSVINNILDLSKIEAGEVNLENIEFNLLELLEEVIAIFSVSSEKNNTDIWLDYEYKDPIYVTGDPLRIKQILTNLVGNALKFTTDGEISVRIHKEDGNKILFEIADTGIGISPESIDKIFKPFSQAELNTARKHGGTGLGLAITKNLVEMMHGKIWCESILGKGSKFLFIVEFDAIHFKEDQVVSDFPSINILCLSDSLRNQKTIQRPLSLMNITCDLASVETDFLANLTSRPGHYNLIIINNPKNDNKSLDLIKQIRSHVNFRDMRVLLITSFSFKYCAEDAMLDASLKRPFTTRKLFHAIKSPKQKA